MRDASFHQLPRLYINAALAAGAGLPLTPDQARYLTSVLRRENGATVRVFNGAHGEWLCTLQSLGKKNWGLRCDEQLKTQPPTPTPLTLAFCPLKRGPMEWLCEKATELGATALQPVISQRTQPREFNEARLTAIMVEAAEQCERLFLPKLHEPKPLPAWLATAGPVVVGVERDMEGLVRKPLRSLFHTGPITLLVGPEGGFTDEELVFFGKHADIYAATLGDNILRAETAALAMLTLWKNQD